MTTATKSAISKVAKLDTDIAALRERLESKLGEREAILAELIADGEAIRAAVGLTVAPVADEPIDRTVLGINLVTTGKALTVEQVLDIRSQYAAGVSQSAIARQYGLSQPSIHNIVKRNTYKDVA